MLFLSDYLPTNLTYVACRIDVYNSGFNDMTFSQLYPPNEFDMNTFTFTNTNNKVDSRCDDDNYDINAHKSSNWYQSTTNTADKLCARFTVLHWHNYMQSISKSKPYLIKAARLYSKHNQHHQYQ